MTSGDPRYPRQIPFARPESLTRVIAVASGKGGVGKSSVNLLTTGNSPVVMRGPMLHRVLEQFLADVHWGALDVLFLDLPPGTGDIAIPVGQLLPAAERRRGLAPTNRT